MSFRFNFTYLEQCVEVDNMFADRDDYEYWAAIDA